MATVQGLIDDAGSGQGREAEGGEGLGRAASGRHRHRVGLGRAVNGGNRVGDRAGEVVGRHAADCGVPATATEAPVVVNVATRAVTFVP